MTNFERIKLMSIEDMADYIYAHDDELNDRICKFHGECPYGDDVRVENCKECVKHWLESEAEK